GPWGPETLQLTRRGKPVLLSPAESCSPWWAVSMASTVPSPPSAMGMVLIWAAGIDRSNPRVMAAAASPALSAPLNESGMTANFMASSVNPSLGMGWKALSRGLEGPRLREVFVVLDDKQAQDPHEEHCGDAHEASHHGLRAVGLLRGHLGEVRNDPEVRVIRVGHGQRACGDRHDSEADLQGGLQTKDRQERGDDTGGRDHGNRRRTLCRLEEGGDEEREEQAEAC